MGNSFFVAFKKIQDARELEEITRRMNQVNFCYDSNGGLAIEVVREVLHGKDGFTVKMAGNEQCYGLLWRKYFCLSHDDDKPVYFFDREYETKMRDWKIITSETA